MGDGREGESIESICEVLRGELSAEDSCSYYVSGGENPVILWGKCLVVGVVVGWLREVSRGLGEWIARGWALYGRLLSSEGAELAPVVVCESSHDRAEDETVSGEGVKRLGGLDCEREPGEFCEEVRGASDGIEPWLFQSEEYLEAFGLSESGPDC